MGVGAALSDWVMAQPADDHSSGGSRARSTPASDDAEPGKGTLGPAPPPLPTDPKVRAELFARLERGIADARAGRGEDREVVHARIRDRLKLPEP